MQSKTSQAAAAIHRINRAWLDRRPEDLVPLLHPDVTLVFPGFSGRAQGREAIVAGFVDFCAMPQFTSTARPINRWTWSAIRP